MSSPEKMIGRYDFSSRLIHIHEISKAHVFIRIRINYKDLRIQCRSKFFQLFKFGACF